MYLRQQSPGNRQSQHGVPLSVTGRENQSRAAFSLLAFCDISAERGLRSSFTSCSCVVPPDEGGRRDPGRAAGVPGAGVARHGPRHTEGLATELRLELRRVAAKLV